MNQGSTSTLNPDSSHHLHPTSLTNPMPLSSQPCGWFRNWDTIPKDIQNLHIRQWKKQEKRLLKIDGPYNYFFDGVQKDWKRKIEWDMDQ